MVKIVEGVTLWAMDHELEHTGSSIRVSLSDSLAASCTLWSAAAFAFAAWAPWDAGSLVTLAIGAGASWLGGTATSALVISAAAGLLAAVGARGAGLTLAVGSALALLLCCSCFFVFVSVGFHVLFELMKRGGRYHTLRICEDLFSVILILYKTFVFNS